MSNTNNTAAGQLAGYLFQPDRALYYLSALRSRKQSVSIELIDDIAIHDNASVILTEQDKHTISQSTKSNFSNSSKELWRTLQIWTQKLEDKNLLLDNCKFICCSNKSISTSSLIFKISNANTRETAIELFEALKNLCEERMAKYPAKNGVVSDEILKIMLEVISDKERLINLIQKIEIEDNQTIEHINEAIINNLNLSDSNIHKHKILLQMKGWLSERCRLLSSNNKNIVITKEEFNQAYEDAINSYNLSGLSFSAKKTLTDEIDDVHVEAHHSSTFVEQIKLIKHRNIKELIINAIIDYLCYEKELVNIARYAHITQQDFLEFHDLNKQRWTQIFNRYVVKEIEEYTADQLDEFAFRIYDEIQSLQIQFKLYDIPISSAYFKNGCFHLMANELEIGWHPNWGKIFVNEET